MSVVRIQGIPLESHKHIVIALRGVYGIGQTRAKSVCAQCKIQEHIKVKDLTESQIVSLQKSASEYILEGDLRRDISMRIKQLRDSGCYRGMRHKHGLPLRGQNTRNNARTRKGKRGKVVATNKK